MSVEYISPQRLHDALERNEDIAVIDVRDPDEYAEGHIPGARNIPVDELEERLDEVPDADLVVTY